MSIKHIAAAVITPAAIVGMALSTGAAANAATIHHSADNQWVTVRAGDTLTGIAAAHHMSWEALYATPPNFRRISNPNLIFVGERVRIPADPSMRAAQFASLHLQALAPAQPAPVQPVNAEVPAQQSAAPTQSDAAGPTSTAGESSFEQCVAWRESSDTPTDPDGLYGILPSVWESLGYSGTAGQASVAQQQQAFNRLYAEDGAQPWAPSDGC